jgi:hypothetical protein
MNKQSDAPPATGARRNFDNLQPDFKGWPLVAGTHRLKVAANTSARCLSATTAPEGFSSRAGSGPVFQKEPWRPCKGACKRSTCLALHQLA